MKIDLKKIFILLFIIIAVLCGLWYVFFVMDAGSGDIPEISDVVKDDTETVPVTYTPVPSALINVFVCGAVNCEGVFSLPEDSLVIDAVNAAGGFRNDADRDYLNLARQVKNNERIYVPTISETNSLSTVEDIKGTGVKITNEESVTGKSAVSSGGSTEMLININTASISELTALPGIGEARAKEIVSYRTNVGAFREISDIKNVSGIGDKMFERLKAYITVE